MDLSTGSRGLDPQDSASDRDGLGGADHAVEHLDSEGDLSRAERAGRGHAAGVSKTWGNLLASLGVNSLAGA